MAQNKKRCLNCGHEVDHYDSIGEGVYKCPACGAETRAQRQIKDVRIERR